MVCFASQRNLGQNEDTSCYLIFLQELNGGGERSSLLPSPPLPPPFRKIRSSRCHSLKATRHYCPFFWAAGPWRESRAMGSEEAAAINGFLAGHGNLFSGNLFPPHFCLLMDITAKELTAKKTDSLEWNKGSYFWSGEKGMFWYEPSQPSIPISS